MTGATAEARLTACLAAPARHRGRFKLHVSPDAVACLPASFDRGRLSSVQVFAPPLPPTAWTPRAAARLAVSLRQAAWRALQATRGLVPVTLVEASGGRMAATVLLCHLDGAAASPRALDTLARIFDDAALRHSLRWACRSRPRRIRPCDEG